MLKSSMVLLTLRMGIIIIGIADAFCWGLYWETVKIARDNPLGTEPMQCHLGMTSFSLLAMIFIFSSADILIRALRTNQWMNMQRDLFYCAVFLGIVCLMTGFEFLFWLDWQYVNPIPFLLLKAAFTGLLVVFLVRIVRTVWQPPLSSG